MLKIICRGASIFPINRHFRWRTAVILVVLYFIGNLAGIPLLRKTSVPIEPVWQWGVATFIFAIVIAISLWMATRTGLGVPFLEDTISKEYLPNWFCIGLALSILMIVVATPFSLIVNLNVDAATYPFGWELLLASFKAGVVEEIGARFFLMTLIVWLGSFICKTTEGRPTRTIYWAGILLAGLAFGWAHVDTRLGIAGVPIWWYALLMFLNTGLGVFFGWLYWQLGLEWSILAHFIFDAYLSMVLVPVHLSGNPVIWAMLIVGLLVVGLMALRFLVRKPAVLSS